jgi:hypothetical protein
MEVAALTAFLAPFVPYLVKGGEKLATEVGQTLGREGLEHAKRLWAKLRAGVEDDASATAAAEKVAERPQDTRAQGALELALEDLLAADPALAHDVAELWSQVPPGVVAAVGERSVAVGGDVSGSTIVTGDSNVIRE